MGKWEHRLSNVDRFNRQASCEKCGLVEIGMNSKSQPYCLPGYRSKGRERYAAATAEDRPTGAERLWQVVQEQAEKGWTLAFIKDGEVREIFILS